MKKYLLVCLILSIILIQGAHALSTDMKENYEAKETAIIKIIGNVLEPIAKEQVEVKRNNVLIPVEYDVKNLNGEYYLWLIAPEIKNNYSLIIKNVSTVVSGEARKIDFMQNFSVSGNISDYTIKPGFIVSKNNFELGIELNEETSKTISIDFPEKKDVVLRPGKNVLSFTTSEIQGTQFIFIQAGKYKIPAYLTGNALPSAQKEPLFFEPLEIRDVRLVSEKNIYYQFSITNRGDKKIENVYIEHDEDIFDISPDKKIDIAQGDKVYYNITLKSREPEVSAKLYIKSEEENISLEMPIALSLLKNVSELVANKSAGLSGGNKTSLKCSEFSGKICPSGNTCAGDSLQSSDGVCCIGQCNAEKKSGGWIGYFIISFVIVGLLYVFFRYYKAKKQ